MTHSIDFHKVLQNFAAAAIIALATLGTTSPGNCGIQSNDEIYTNSAVKKESGNTQQQSNSQDELWEQIVSLPGKVIYFTLHLLFDVTKGTIWFVDESKIAPRTKDFLTADDGSWAFFPVYSSRGGAGVKYFHNGPFGYGERVTLNASAGLRRRQRYQAGIQQINLFNNAVSADFMINYRMYSDERFFGVGPDTQEKSETNYAREQLSVNAAFSVTMSEHTSAVFQLGIEKNNILSGRNTNSPSTNTLFSGASLPGLRTSIELANAGLSILHDSRNHPGHTTAGGIDRFMLGVYTQTDDDIYGFWWASIDIKRYFNLFFERVLILRVSGAVVEQYADRQIPFYYLSELGHKETIRGFKRGRFRDNDMVLGSLEYRYPLMTPVDAVLFLDAGQVADNIFNDFSADNFHYGYGGGFNIWTENSIAAQLILGKSKDGLRFYLNLNQEF